MTSETTRYSRKRRLLRQHREQMRVMEDLIWDHDLQADLDLRMYHETGNTQAWLGHHAFMDEDSDASDPEEELGAENERLRREARESRALVDAAVAMAESEVIRRDLERARMACEDSISCSSGLLRSASRASAQATVLCEVLSEEVAVVERPAVFGELAELEGRTGHPVPDRPAAFPDAVVVPVHPGLKEGL